MKSLPLISVGIPTYNRPEGLKRTLDLICSQTYKNLEIIISDNASDHNEVYKIIEEFLKFDKRIKYYKQTINIGASNNFSFVLKNATGDYFMWAADDDYWNPRCIEYYHSKIKSYSAFFSSYGLKVNGIDTKQTDFVLLNGETKTKDIINFLYSPCPSLIYGLFKRENLLNIYEDMNFDWGDCYLLIKYIKTYGYKTEFSDEIMYYAGVDDDKYVVKVTNKKFLNPWIFFFKTLGFVFPSSLEATRLLFKFSYSNWLKRHEIIRDFK